MGYFTTEAAARDRDGQGRLVEDDEGAVGWRYDLPPGWAVERVEIEDLTAAQAEAVAMAAKECDGGCAHCVNHQLEVLTSIWPQIPWPAVVQSISTLSEDTVGSEAEWEAAAGAVDEAVEKTVTTQPLADDDRASMLHHAQQILAERSAGPAATFHGQPDRTAHQNATAVVRLVEEVDRLQHVASQLDADLRDAVVQQHQLLRATDRLRQQRIVVLGPDHGGDCVLCLTGRYNIVSAATELYQRPDDGVVVAISGVPIVECDVCGHALVTLDVAHGVEALRDFADARPGDRDRVLWLDWSDRPGRGPPDAEGRS